MPVTRLHSASELYKEFCKHGRQSNFSADAIDWLWAYLEQLEDDIGTPIEIDVIGLCCDYSEEDYESIASSYNIDLPERDGDEEDHAEAVREAIIDYLRENTVVLGYDDDSVLYASF